MIHRKNIENVENIRVESSNKRIYVQGIDETSKEGKYKMKSGVSGPV